MSDWVKWVLGIVAFLICASVIAIWKLVAGKVDKYELARSIELLDKDIKETDARIDQSLIAIAQGVSKTDLIDKMAAASTRTDDQDRRVQRDITELKSDMKSTIEKLSAVDKKLDELPTRVASLESTRNQSTRNQNQKN